MSTPELSTDDKEVTMMQTTNLQLNDVIYNAAESSFEALVTVNEGGKSLRYACAINAPISMDFAEAARGLSKQAIRRHRNYVGMRSEIVSPHPELRAGRPKFDPRRWLENLMHLPGSKAA
jgi:hypothetical protein